MCLSEVSGEATGRLAGLRGDWSAECFGNARATVPTPI